ncbi:BREX system P-loop protein BrxC [Myxococcota bacterium]|nr:BREX system P-loop protein BrxC [Myxococcota bacterium]
MERIAELFARDVDRRIEEVVKVDDDDLARIRHELSEYVVTDSIRRQQIAILEAYLEAFRKPHDGTAVWISGFFGSGKSSFAKMLGLAIEDRDLGGGARAGDLLARRLSVPKDNKAEVLLRQVNEMVPTEAVIFDVSTDRGIRAGNQSITEIMYRLFLQRLGYARELDLAELEITLEAEGRLGAFVAKYAELHDRRAWDHDKGLPALAIGRASAVMHALEPRTYNAPDSWVKGAKGRGDVTPALLADRCLELLSRRRPEKRNLLFVIDEVGQFVAKDGGKLEDLRAVVERLGQRGGGRIWVMVTSQEALSELVGGLDQTRIELPKVKDRFPLQVHLEPSDISEVTSRRVLEKHADAQARLRALHREHRGRLVDHTRVHAPNVALPELTDQGFIDLYPLLPYQIDLVINVVSGLRTQGGASKHVGGAARTIIKLAQQLLIHPEVDLASKPEGTLVTLDRVYDLVSGNVSSDVRRKIDDIGREVPHPRAQAVAKAVCLLQYEQRIPRTAENVAATLHPSVTADSQLPEVKAALDALVAAGRIRLGEDGYRIPTPAEDDWEGQRGKLSLRPADAARIHAEVVDGLWTPQPSHLLRDVKPFRAGLFLNNRLVTPGDVPVHVSLAPDEAEWGRLREEWRQRSREERTAVFWIARLDDAVDRVTEEVFRSQEILARRERNATTRDETALVAEEKRRRQRHQDDLRRRLREALLSGTVYFRGNERNPEAGAADVGRACAGVLARVLPEVFDRFSDGAAKVSAKDLEALLTTENLRGLPPVFSQLQLVQETRGKPAFRTEGGPLSEVMNRIAHKAAYGELVSGRALADELGKEPFGWDFDVVRLLVASLLRAGKVEAVSRGQVIDNALSLDARTTFTNNNLFRQATFRPKVSVDYGELVKADGHFRDVFGKEIAELEPGVVARAIKDEVHRHEQALQDVHNRLVRDDLPGAEVLARALEQVRVIRTGGDDNAITTFNASCGEIKAGIKRAAELDDALTEPRLLDLARARDAVRRQWPFLKEEPDLPEGLAARAEELDDLLRRETFFRELPRIDEHAREVGAAWRARFDAAVEARRAAYAAAVERLRGAPEWSQLDAAQQARVEAPLAGPATTALPPPTPIPQVRAETEACPARLQAATEEMLRMIDGNRVVRVRVSSFFPGGVETPEQLDAAIQALRDECERLIGEGKKVWVQ